MLSAEIDLLKAKKQFMKLGYTEDEWVAFFASLKKSGAILRVFKDRVEDEGHLWTLNAR